MYTLYIIHNICIDFNQSFRLVENFKKNLFIPLIGRGEGRNIYTAEAKKKNTK